MTTLKDLSERVALLESENKRLNDSLVSLSSELVEVSLALVKVNSGELAEDISGVVTASVLQRVLPMFAQQLGIMNDAHKAEIKEKHLGWYQHYQEKLQGNQLLWTGLLSVMLTVIFVGCFGWFSSFTDGHIRALMDLEKSRVDIILDNFKEKLTHHK